MFGILALKEFTNSLHMISNYVFTLVQNCAEYIFGGLDRFTNFFGQK